MRLTLSRKVCVSAMGIGVISMLGSIGTFAAFTATTTNPGNTFTAGNLTLTDTTGFTSPTITLGQGAPNLTGSDPRTASDCPVAIVAFVCSSLLRSVNVAAPGIEAGQYLQGTITIANSGTLPATISLQIQNIKTNNGNGSVTSGAAGVNPCAADINGVSVPAATGAQLTTGATTGTSFGGAVPLTGCADLGNALRVTIQDAGAVGTGPQCVFGNDTGGGVNGNNNLQAPIQAALNTSGPGLQTYVATGRPLGQGSGVCDDFGQVGALGSASHPVLPGANPKDQFGTQTAPSAGTFASLNGTSSFIFVPGAGSSRSILNDVNVGGNLTNMPQWSANESHTFTVTIALPDTGTTRITDRNNDVYDVGNDNPYQGGAVSFDLYWFASQ
jgi:predicted ribosomally synthesized peptide with SipW-like signal peptide